MHWTLLLGLLANAGVLLAATIARLKVDSATVARLMASSFVLALSFAAAASASFMQAPAPFPVGFMQNQGFAQHDEFYGSQALGILAALGGGVGLFLLVVACARLAQAQVPPPVEEYDEQDERSYEEGDAAHDRRDELG